MTRRTCPTCGGELQATAVRYLSDVELDDTGTIVGYRTTDAPVNDPNGYAWDRSAVRVYCENDHEINWDLPYCAEGYQRDRAAGSSTNR